MFRFLGNFTPAEVGEPFMEVELRPGDLLYFPRGFIHEVCAFIVLNIKAVTHICLAFWQGMNKWDVHQLLRHICIFKLHYPHISSLSKKLFQAVASKDEHSLHLTISTTQRNTVGDFLRIVSIFSVSLLFSSDVQ
jgi:hypothetical protein